MTKTVQRVGVLRSMIYLSSARSYCLLLKPGIVDTVVILTGLNVRMKRRAGNLSSGYV